MPTLYVSASGASLHLHDRQLVVAEGERELTRLPLRLVELVVLQGPCHLSPASISACLGQGVPIAHLSARGEFLGRLEPVSPEIGALQREQLRAADTPERCLALARAWVAAKLHNGRVALMHWKVSDELDVLHHAELMAIEAADLASLRGYEGAGAAAYFRQYGRHLGPAWGFERRIAHPPVGAVNAALSYGYTLLFNLMLSAVRAAGLNAHVGFFHADREGHATLASDMMEPWRPVLVDRFVMHLLHGGILSPADFEEATEGTRLTPAGRRTFLAAWEAHLDERITLPSVGTRFPYRIAVQQQVLHFARHLRAPDEVPYVPMRLHG